MGTHSRTTRSGQNSGIEKRPTRARGLAQQTSASQGATSSAPAISSSSTSRPGSANKNLIIKTSTRRGSLDASKKPANQRPSARTTHRQAPARIPDHEEIFAEIVVKSESTDDDIGMDDEPSEMFSTPVPSSTSIPDVSVPTELTVADPDTTYSPQSPPVRQSQEASMSIRKAAPEFENSGNGIDSSSKAIDASTPESLDDLSVLSSTPVPDEPMFLHSQTIPPSPPLLNGNEPDSVSETFEKSSMGHQRPSHPGSEIGSPLAVAAKEIDDPPETATQMEPFENEEAMAIDFTQPSNVEESPEMSSPDRNLAIRESINREKTQSDGTNEELLSSPTQASGNQGRLDEDVTNKTTVTGACPFSKRPELTCSVPSSSSTSTRVSDNQNDSTGKHTLTKPNYAVLRHPRLQTKSDIDSGQYKPILQTSDCSAASLPTSIPQSADLLLVKVESPEHTPREVPKAGLRTTKPAETPNLENVSQKGTRVKTSAVGSPTTIPNRVDADETSESELSEVASVGPGLEDTTLSDPTPFKSAISHLIGESRHSFASSASAHTERSGLSSKPPSVSSKATTPFDVGSPREPLTQFFNPTTQIRPTHRIQFNVRPKVSIPADLTSQQYAIQCIEAAENSRLNPYALHREEYCILRDHISHAQVTTYLNIRNGILRLWVRNPQIAVTREEAIGCAKDTRWFDVANVCFDWLVRRGFINYGCVEIRQSKSNANSAQPRRRKTIAIIGAGFSGLGCARQLTGLSQQYAKRFRDMGEEPPRIVVLEGRTRVGGRVYSRAFQTLPDTAPGIFRGKRFTAEMGGMIITGFDRGNPLNILVRGQLGLPYHCLRSDMSLYDTNGTAVDPVRDQLVEHLFNACLDRVSEYKFKMPPAKLIEGNHDLMDEGKDSSAEGHKTIALVEETAAAQPHALPVSEQNVAPQVNLVPVSTDRMTGKVHVQPGTPGSMRAAFKAKSLGWTLKAGVSETKDIELDTAANDPRATLGSVVDEALMQHKDILDLTAQDFRLLNWHIANLEYSNATNLNKLSIKGWDIDAGNEWEGKHTMVVGGYQSVARGLSMLPTPLDIQHKAAVRQISYAAEGGTGSARIVLENEQTVEADYVVNTIPLGVLKHGSIKFEPSLPSWKSEAIERLGFGVLNKVILVYKEAFWDKDRDIFGMLQTPTNRLSLNQKDYASRRGRFFQWFNVTNTTGMPCLLALMAGDAGYDTDVTPNDELIAEATEVLRMRYGARVTQPLEALITRWESDRFSRGSYSNAGVNMTADDYNLMAKPIGNLYFAGEHTSVTHPATVHGAYLSGLRAAAEVFDSILGPIEVPTPLVLPRETAASLKRKAQEELRDPAQARLEAYELEIAEHIRSKLGPYPLKPVKLVSNPYLLFNKVYYDAGRKRCEEGRRAGKGKPSPNEVRTMTSKMWKEAPPEVRKPFEDQNEEQKRVFSQALKDWTEAAARWEHEAIALRENYVKEHPSLPTAEELAATNNKTDGGSWPPGGRRAAKRVESYAEDDSDVEMD